MEIFNPLKLHMTIVFSMFKNHMKLFVMELTWEGGIWFFQLYMMDLPILPDERRSKNSVKEVNH